MGRPSTDWKCQWPNGERVYRSIHDSISSGQGSA